MCQVVARLCAISSRAIIIHFNQTTTTTTTTTKEFRKSSICCRYHTNGSIRFVVGCSMIVHWPSAS
ncbi:MAG: hypothetical protein N6V41_01370, partial [Candidatus Portiera aleyrodidarum]|nr:hypothetical protein [Candidatus Portiera aleyrodidarum]